MPADHLVLKLWEASEDGLLNADESTTVAAFCNLFDSDPDAF